MKKIIIPILLLSLIIVSCKEKEKFVEPDFVLKKWAGAIKSLNYKRYKECEAYPKSGGVFSNMYKSYYPSDIMVVSIEDLDEEDIKKDYKGASYHQRKVEFEFTEISRKRKRAVQLVRGDVFFVKFLDGLNVKKGWLMANRTLTRVKRK